MNPARNEIKIKLGSREYVCRPTFAAIAGIEGQLNKSVWKIATEIRDSTFPVSQMAVVLMYMLSTAGSNFTVEKCGEALMEEGASELSLSVALFCLNAFQGAKNVEDSPLGKPAGQPEPTEQDHGRATNPDHPPTIN